VFYDRFVYLCGKKGISPSRAAVEAGISKSLVTKWRTNNVQDPSPDVARKLANYFNMTIAELLGEETKKAPTVSSERAVSDDDIKFALFGGSGEITDAMYREVKEFAALVKLREDMKRSKE
jgi:transcriptional regulator with XRE-family HTH domain